MKLLGKVTVTNTTNYKGKDYVVVKPFEGFSGERINDEKVWYRLSEFEKSGVTPVIGESYVLYYDYFDYYKNGKMNRFFGLTTIVPCKKE